MEKLVSYTEFLVKSICKCADKVKVNVTNDDDLIILDVLVDESDLGCVIGKSGRMASSLRTLILAYAYVNELGKIKVNFNSLT